MKKEIWFRAFSKLFARAGGRLLLALLRAGGRLDEDAWACLDSREPDDIVFHTRSMAVRPWGPPVWDSPQLCGLAAHN